MSIVGLREHMVSYLSSGKSRQASFVFSKQGSKGTFPLLEKILENSMSVCRFQAPINKSIYVSFDNIQKLYKNYRLGVNEQEKAIAAIVTSVLCILPDGELESKIQFDRQYSPEFWLYGFRNSKQNNFAVTDLDSNILKGLIKDDCDVTQIKMIFRKKLDKAIIAVKEDMNLCLEDSVDIELAQQLEKRQKRLVEPNKSFSAQKSFKMSRSDKSKKILHCDVVNIQSESKPCAISMGAVEVNPNTPDRIAEVLDSIQKQCDIYHKYSFKYIFDEEGKVRKIENSNCNEDRKYIIVTADGLPYKQLIKLINDFFVCITCENVLCYLADMTEHMKTHGHKEYFQKYGNILPQIGQFHYGLTMLRSYVKLVWNINLSELCKAINFESPKAQIVQEKVKDFHKSLDTFRISQEAKICELVYPYVKYAMEHNIPTSVESYYTWKKFFVKNENYHLVQGIEELYGTSFSLFHSSLRANNSESAQLTKRAFSPIFHIINN